MYITTDTYNMNKNRAASKLQQQFQTRLMAFWPALKGSLTQVRKPCIRPQCQACARGDKHPAYLLSFSQGGRRRCMYVPVALAGAIQRGLRNGRALEQLLSKMGPALIREHRQTRTVGPTSRPAATRSKSTPSRQKRSLKN